MANQLMNTTTNAAIIPEIWSAKFYETLHAQLPFIDIVDQSYAGEIRSMGDIVNISTVPSFDQATLLGEGVAGESESVTITSQALTINARAYKDVMVTREADLQSIPFMDKVRDEMIYSIMKKIQADIIAAIVPSAANPDNAIAFDNGTTLALADILEAKELLDGVNVPDMNRVAVLGHLQTADLFNITGFVSKDFNGTAGSPLSEGSINFPIVGFKVKTTTIVGNVSYFFHPSFMTMAIQESLNFKMFDMGVDGVRAMRLNADVLYGIKQLSNLRVVSIS